METLYKPKFIVVEGTTCSGKTTFAKGIVRKLNSCNIDALYIKTLPSETSRGNSIRTQRSKLPDIDLDLLYLDDLYKTIEEAQSLLECGKTVVFDRYLPSLLSFCRRYRDFRDYEQLIKTLDFEKINSPDIIFLLYASNKIKLQRMNDKDNISSFDQESINDTLLEQYLIREARYFDPILVDTGLLNEEETINFGLGRIVNQKGI